MHDVALLLRTSHANGGAKQVPWPRGMDAELHKQRTTLVLPGTEAVSSFESNRRVARRDCPE